MILVHTLNQKGSASGFGAKTLTALLCLVSLGMSACDYGPEELGDSETQDPNELKIAQKFGGAGTFGDFNEPYPYFDCAMYYGGCNFVSYNAASFCGDVSPISATKITVNSVPKLKIKLNWCIASDDLGCDSGEFRLPAGGTIGTVRFYSGSNLVHTASITGVSLILSSPYDYGYSYVNTNGVAYDRVAISISAGVSHAASTTSTTTFSASGTASASK